jgi:diadenosine tetraphosphate (Ap4A) HIT family hydrolase
MAETIRKHQKELKRIIAEFTTDHDIQPAKSGHIAITIRRNGAQRTVFSPLTPSDHRSMLNVKTKIRRAFNEMVAAV